MVGLVAGAVMFGVVVVVPGMVLVAPGVVPTPFVVLVAGVVPPAGNPVEVEVPVPHRVESGVIVVADDVDAGGVIPDGVVPGELMVAVPAAELVPLGVVVPLVGPAQRPDWGVVDEVADGNVAEAAGVVLGSELSVVEVAGVVPVCEPAAIPGAVVVGMAGVVPPAAGVCAAAIATVRHTAAANVSKRLNIGISWF